MFVCLLLVFTSLALSSVHSYISAPLYRTYNIPRTIESYVREIENFNQTYVAFQTKGGGGVTQKKELTNFMNAIYYTTFSMGTPPQLFFFLIDTGSADLWVTSNKCKSVACTKHRQYDSSKSSTFKAKNKKVTITYGTGKIEGFVGSDTLKIGDINIPNQGFIEITVLSDFPFISIPIEGICGVGFPSISESKEATPMDNMIKNGLIKEPIFSLYISRKVKDPVGGEIVFGGMNENYFQKNTLTAFPLTETSYWLIKMDHVTVSSEKGPFMCTNGCSAIIDSGTSLISGPSEDIDKINKLFKARKDNNLAVVSCDYQSKGPNITLQFSGKQFTLTSQDYVIKTDKGDCLLGFSTMNLPGKPWIIGDVFLGTVYSVYNVQNKTVSFAKLKGR